MAFYPTWQADPSQGWQNQFIQQIPQNTTGISALNSIDFQPQVNYYIFFFLFATIIKEKKTIEIC